MGRPKEFDPETALDRAMEVFWRQGFKATSIQDLVEAMGINRGSLYDTFGGKDELYQKALARYCDTRIRGLLDRLAAPGEPREVVREVFAGIAESSGTEEGKFGCLLTNSAVELAPHCAQTQAAVATSMSRIEDGFCALLQRGGRHADNARAIARFLVGNLQGLSVVAKTTPTREALMDVVDVIVSVIE